MLHPLSRMCVIVGEGTDCVPWSQRRCSRSGCSTLAGLQLMVLSLPWTKGQRREDSPLTIHHPHPSTLTASLELIETESDIQYHAYTQCSQNVPAFRDQ